MPPSLSALNIPPSRLPKLAEEAAGQWTAQFNPRPITTSDFEAVYAAAL
jgi:alcohol dehydrogenase